MRAADWEQTIARLLIKMQFACCGQKRCTEHHEKTRNEQDLRRAFPLSFCGANLFPFLSLSLCTYTHIPTHGTRPQHGRPTDGSHYELHTVAILFHLPPSRAQRSPSPVLPSFTPSSVTLIRNVTYWSGSLLLIYVPQVLLLKWCAWTGCSLWGHKRAPATLGEQQSGPCPLRARITVH